MPRPAVFFDRDNTLIICDGYLGDPAQVVLVEGAAEAVARARALGYAVVVFSNQSGVGRGMFGEDAVHAVNARLDELLQEDDPSAVIDRHEFCPFHPQATVERYRQDSDLRKPKPGMIHQAAKQLNLDLSRSWVVGDAPRDVEAGHAAGVRTVLVKNPSLHASPAALEELTAQPDYEARNLREAMGLIERHGAAAAAVAEPVEPAAGETSDEPPPARAEQPPVAAAAPAPVSDAPATPKLTWAERQKARLAAERAGIAATPVAAPTSSPTPPAAASPATAAPAPVEATVSNPAPVAATPSPAAAPAKATPAATPIRPTTRPEAPDPSRTEELLEEILKQLRLRNDADAPGDFSVPKLLSGVVQVLVLAVLFWAYLNRGDRPTLDSSLLFALVLQVLTISLLIMGRQR